jgi:2-polyprenyl-6-methoxyphenol hydroxylase-like FAD-dependent oxidoreductase
MSSTSKKVIVIGAGFAGLSTASFLAKMGWEVTVIEKHDYLVVEQESLQQKGLHLIWVQAGIGCQIFLKGILTPLVKK